jgi:hypothetical protein
MKKTTKPNPLKFFNDNKAMAYKKAGGAMDAFKKSLRKAPDGGFTGPQPMIGPKTQEQAMISDIMSSQPPIPFANKPTLNERAGKAMMDSINNKPAYVPQGRDVPKGTYEEYKRKSPSQPKSPSDAERRFNEMKYSQGAKKGGSVKRKK